MLIVLIEVLGHMPRFKSTFMVVISPSRGKFITRIKFSQFIGIDQMGGRSWVHVRAELVLELDWDLVDFLEFVCK